MSCLASSQVSTWDVLVNTHTQFCRVQFSSSIITFPSHNPISCSWRFPAKDITCRHAYYMQSIELVINCLPVLGYDVCLSSWLVGWFSWRGTIVRPSLTIVSAKPYAYEWQLFPITVLLKQEGNAFDSLCVASRSVVLYTVHKTRVRLDIERRNWGKFPIWLDGNRGKT
jgi:hypothetical protein